MWSKHYVLLAQQSAILVLNTNYFFVIWQSLIENIHIYDKGASDVSEEESDFDDDVVSEFRLRVQYISTCNESLSRAVAGHPSEVLQFHQIIVCLKRSCKSYFITALNFRILCFRSRSLWCRTRCPSCAMTAERYSGIQSSFRVISTSVPRDSNPSWASHERQTYLNLSMSIFSFLVWLISRKNTAKWP